MATTSSVPAWRIPGTGEPWWAVSMGSHRVGHNLSDLATAAENSLKLQFREKSYFILFILFLSIMALFLSHCAIAGFFFFKSKS